MQNTVVAAAALSLMVSVGSVAHGDPLTQVVGQVTDAKHLPVEGAIVLVGAQEAVTNAHGVYRVVLPGAGTYPVAIDYQGAHVARSLELSDGQTAVADAALDLAVGEVIHVQDHLVAPVAPRQVGDPGILPRYSAAAAASDTWTRAWMLLDIDETGSVQRVKWLKHPGHDLDGIAVETAMATKFTPARDEHDAPKRALLVHEIEWPSYWWLVAVNEGVTTHMPKSNGYELRPQDGVPCAGSGPLHMGSVHPVYRDCSAAPDPAKFANEPWIVATR